MRCPLDGLRVAGYFVIRMVKGQRVLFDLCLVFRIGRSGARGVCFLGIGFYFVRFAWVFEREVEITRWRPTVSDALGDVVS